MLDIVVYLRELQQVMDASLGEVFARTDNLDHCIRYLNNQLSSLGICNGLALLNDEPVRTVRYL